MMGVGKSTIGKLLSKRLKISFEDLDSRLEKIESLTIYEIFEFMGEDYFRKIEENESLKMIKKKSKVIALGGGTFINPRVRRDIKKNCLSIWLDLIPKEIFNRVRKNKRRPLLKNAKSFKDVEKIYLSRKKIYSFADYRLNCNFKSTHQIVKEIEKIYYDVNN